MLGLFFSLILLLLFFNIPLLLFHLYIFLCFDPSICYLFPCLFISSICYLAFLSCSVLLFASHLVFVVLYILYQCIMIRFSYCKLVPL